MITRPRNQRRPKVGGPPPLAWASGASLAATVVPTLGVLVGYPLLVRGLGVTGFGLVTFAMGAVSLVGLVESGLGNAVVYMVARDLAERDGDETYGATASTILLVASGIGVLALWPLAPTLARSLIGHDADGLQTATYALRLAVLHLPFTLQVLNRVSVLKGHQLFGRAAALAAGNVVLTSLLGGWLTLAKGWSPAGYLGWSLGVEIVVAFGGILLAWNVAPWGSPSWSAARDLWGYGSRVLVVSASSILLMQLPRVAGGLAFGPVGSAAIQMGYSVPSRLTMLTRAATEPLMPRLVHPAGGLTTGASRLVQRFSVSIGALTVSGFLLLAIFAEPMLTLWLGEGGVPAGAVLALRIISIGLIVNAVSQPWFYALNAAHQPGANARASLVGSTVLLMGVAGSWLVGWPGEIASLAVSVCIALVSMSAVVIVKGRSVVGQVARNERTRD